MGDNKRNKVCVEFDVTDLPMIADAFSIARNTAMMCGHHGAKERMEQLREAIEALIPDAARVFDGEVWAEIGMALREGKSWTVGIVRLSWRNSWDRTGVIGVRIDDTTWASESRQTFGPKSPELAAVADLLRDLAPLGCEEVAPDWAADMSIRFALIAPEDLLAALTEVGKAPKEDEALSKDALVQAALKALDDGWGDDLRKKLSELSVVKKKPRKSKSAA